MTEVELQEVRQADLTANGFTSWTWRDRLSPSSRCRIMRFQRRLRLLESLAGRQGVVVRAQQALLWRIHGRDAVALGFTIPLGTCGPGLSLAHYGSIVINDNARLGAQCRIHPGVVIGQSDSGTPTVGDRCYLGAGSKIYGGIALGDEVVVAPNAVVNEDVSANSVVGGVPAKVLRRDVPYQWRH